MFRFCDITSMNKLLAPELELELELLESHAFAEGLAQVSCDAKLCEAW
jgi:hypothetical protein